MQIAEKVEPAMGRPEKYPWDEWIQRCLDGEALIAEEGVDFTCGRQSFRNMLHRVAERRGVKAETATVQNGIAFRFYIQGNTS